ncbi:MAG: EAL domain-containing protein [Pseudomonadota bacterium]
MARRTNDKRQVRQPWPRPWRPAARAREAGGQPDYDSYGSLLRFKRLFEEHPHPMWVYDAVTLRFLVVNAAAVQHYGYTEAEFLDMTIMDIRPPDEHARLAETLATLRQESAQRADYWVHCKKDGTRISVEVSSHALTLAGRPARFVFAHDVTDQLRMETALHESEEMHHLVIDHIPHQIFWKDLDSVYQGCNHVFARAAGVPEPAAIVGMRDTQLPWAHNAERIVAEERAIMASGRANLNQEDHMLFADGSMHWFLINKLPLHDQRGRIIGVLGTIEDVSERKDYQERLEHQANHDALTQLPNRSLFNDRLEQAISYAQRYEHTLLVVFIDLDNFKLVNDNLGHHAGDELLRIVAARLRACVRETDTVARLGGDEFMLILLDGVASTPSQALLQKLLDSVSAPVMLGASEVTISCSVGVSLYPGDGIDAQLLLKQADIAMYRAKEAGRNQVQFYESAMQARVAERAVIEAELRNALARKELSLHYQPKVSLRGGEVTGMEALLRWHHPTLGMVSPARFIGVAEETGLIVAFGRWVIRTACAQAKAWQMAGLPALRVAVNVSARQFRDKGLADDIVAALHDSGLAPRYLELELTESLMMHNIGEVVATVARLKQLGIALSIDDFGTGYSSLSYLKTFPLTYLKIDQSFTRDMLGDPNVAAIVRSVIALGHSLGFKVIAEGVETEAQLAYLRRYQCDEMQGYYFSRPLDTGAFAALLEREQALPPAQPGDPARRTLLLLDDDADVLAALARLLRRDDYLILCAQSAQQAFELLAMHPVHVIVSDQRMPEMNGTDFLGRVKKLYPDTVRIILSGYTDLESVLNAINTGEIYRFYTKPWEDQVLRENIQEAFRYHQLLHGMAP